MKSGVLRDKNSTVSPAWWSSWSIVSEEVSCYGANRRQKVLTEQDVTVISAINFTPGSMNIISVVRSSDTATDTMTDFEKVDRLRRRRSGDTCLFWLPSGAYTRSFWIGIFPIGNFCFWVPLLKQLLLRNCAVDFVEICNVYIEKMIIKATKKISNSDKIWCSYSDLNFGVTFWNTVYILIYVAFFI